MANISGYLQTIKTANSGESVRDAIIKCMKDINEDSAIRATNLTITKDDNVTYTAPKGYAFKNVTVNIDSEGETDPDKTYTYDELVITEQSENKVYPDPEEHPGGNFAYSKVTVDINLDRLTGNILPEAVMTHVVDDPNTPGQKYWDCIEETGYSAVKRIIIGEGAGINLPDYPGSGTTGGQGSADGPYTVTFARADGKRLLSKTGVPKGSYIFTEYPELLSQLEDLIPKHLNGKPYSGTWRNADMPITSNITCTPIYNAATAAIGGDSLAKVMEDGGAHYAIGEEVLIMPDDPVDIPEIRVTGYANGVSASGPQTAIFVAKHNVMPSQFSVWFMIVAHGEGATGTTWLATTDCSTIISRIYNQGQGDITYTNATPGYNNLEIHTTEYGTDDAMGSIGQKAVAMIIPYLLPESVKSHLVECPTKCQYGFNSGAFRASDIKVNPNNFINIISRNPGKIWLPSYAELGSWSADARTNHRYENVYMDSSTAWELDNNGSTIDYTLNGWIPREIRSSAPNNYRISTRSTVIAHHRNDTGPHTFLTALYIANGTAPTDIPSGTSVSAATSTFGNYAYFGFCTT